MEILDSLPVSQCTGCHACYAICPANAIAMKEDVEGFLYPEVDFKKCTNCKLCNKICPTIHQVEKKTPLYVYAVKNQNEDIRKASSSGGMFTLLAETVINDGGVVFGARFNEKWEVIHGYAETMEQSASFRGSKYVQSFIGDTYRQIKDFLDSGKRALFTGTPCQISGLNAFLQKSYDNLLTVDLACAGVSSPAVWNNYLDEFIMSICPEFSPETLRGAIRKINFRDKINGWREFTFSILISIEEKIIKIIESADKNAFMQGFFKALYLRPSCYECPEKSFKSRSDITIADYWGIEKILPELDDNKGISFVAIHTTKGMKIYEQLQKDDRETSAEYFRDGNSDIEESATLTVKRTVFFKKWNDTVKLIPLINKLIKPSLFARTKMMIAAVLRRLGLLDDIKKMLGRK
jgi:coenzyme F420-reducing hydrogenase beta subunit